MSGWLAGAKSGAAIVNVPPVDAPPGTKLLPDEFGVEFPSLEASIRQFWRRGILSPADYYSLSATAKNEAFTISADITQNTLERVHELLAEHLEGPVSREDFQAWVREAVEKLPISDSHLEHVFRNAANESYSQGMETVLDQPLVGDAFPYRAYHAIHDDRVEPEHLAMEKMGLDGTNVYHKDDPTWLRFRPPWRWQCRCGWVPLSVRQAAQLGVAEARAWLDTGVEPQHVWVSPPSWSPPAGWDRMLA